MTRRIPRSAIRVWLGLGRLQWLQPPTFLCKCRSGPETQFRHAESRIAKISARLHRYLVLAIKSPVMYVRGLFKQSGVNSQLFRNCYSRDAAGWRDVVSLS